MPETTVCLANANVSKQILETAWAVAASMFENQLRAKANSTPFGRIGQVEQKGHQWLSDDVCTAVYDAFVSNARKAGPLAKAILKAAEQFRNENFWPAGTIPRHRVALTAKWFVVDLFTQPIFDDDDCDVSARVNLVWTITDSRLVVSLLPVSIADIKIDTGLSLVGIVLPFVQLFELLAGRGEVVPGTVVVNISTSLDGLTRKEQDRIGAQFQVKDVRLKDLWIQGANEFWATFSY